MSKHYGHDADVVGWQIDNEYGYGQMSYDEEGQATVPELAESEIQNAGRFERPLDDVVLEPDLR